MKKKHLLYWLLGLFSTSPVLAFPFMGSYLSVFSILLIFVFVDLVKSKTYKISEYGVVNKFSKWIAISLLSSMWGVIFFGIIGKPQFQQAAVSYVPKLIIFYVLFKLFISRQNEGKMTNFGLGLFYGSIMNIVVAFLDAAAYYSSGYTFVNDFFGTYIAKQQIYMGIITEGYYRASGLNVDQSMLGLLAAYVAAYSFYIKKPYLIIVSMLGNIAAVSFVGMGSVIGVIAIHSANVKTFFRVLVASSVIIAVVLLIDNPYINFMVDAVVARSEMKQDTSDDEDNARAMYWKLFIPAAANNPQSLLIGTGYFTASYPYHTVGYKKAKTNIPYDPEQTYMATYFDIGMIGLIIYILMYWQTYKKLKYYITDENKKRIGLFMAFIEAASISYLGYHFTLGAPETLMTICAVAMVVLYSNKEKSILNKQTKERNS